MFWGKMFFGNYESGKEAIGTYGFGQGNFGITFFGKYKPREPGIYLGKRAGLWAFCVSQASFVAII